MSAAFWSVECQLPDLHGWLALEDIWPDSDDAGAFVTPAFAARAREHARRYAPRGTLFRIVMRTFEVVASDCDSCDIREPMFGCAVCGASDAVLGLCGACVALVTP